jgi:hypothetical protein
MAMLLRASNAAVAIHSTGPDRVGTKRIATSLTLRMLGFNVLIWDWPASEVAGSRRDIDVIWNTKCGSQYREVVQSGKAFLRFFR